MAGEPVRVGIVGLGIAARQVLGSITATEGAKLTAVCDVRADELQRFKQRFGVETFTDLADMCQHGAVDAVWVATPNNYHAEHTVVAADHGKHVICEKPMAISMAEANRMVEAIERNGVIFIPGHSRIYRPYVRKMGEIIQSGRLGRVIRPLTIRTRTVHRTAPGTRRGWWTPRRCLPSTRRAADTWPTLGCSRSSGRSSRGSGC